ncbi:radical SAM protein [Natronoglycomyces albus]|uniref:Radical SAM protein n=1 Tax=Natronoglycomyces albus TaxID=2811108 RepID=A0A895XL16_9ACTN|nr:radical SAM protein [Natronoglycomyces albus]QSB06024.1 radical SAM protein [Natronoglycomyces albus]
MEQQSQSEATALSSTVRRWRRLARRHEIGWSETLLIALNLYGLRGDNPRGMRLRIETDKDIAQELDEDGTEPPAENHDEAAAEPTATATTQVSAVESSADGDIDLSFMTVLPADRPTSPFSLRAYVDPSSPHHGESELCVDGTRVASIVEAHEGEDVSGYLRAGGTAATMQLASEVATDELPKHYRSILKLLGDDVKYSPASEEGLREVMLTAAAIRDEGLVIEHLVALREAMTAEGITSEATIGVLTSAIRSPEGFADLYERAGEVLVFFATETVMPQLVSGRVASDDTGSIRVAEMNVEEIAEVLAAAKDVGHRTSFTYTVGYEPLDELRDQLLPLAMYTTVWPSLTILPAETPADDSQHVAAPEERLDFFLQARSLLEQIFAPTQLRPQPWRCYRGLWYREHASGKLPGPWV